MKGKDIKKILPKQFTCHHVGGRGGSRGFPYISSINHEIISVMYDADEDCLEQIISGSNNQTNQIIVLPLAVADKKAIVNLNITYDPNMSSILDPIPDTGLSYSYPGANFDYEINEAIRVVEKREVEVFSLDEILLSYKEIPKPIFLSLDTQGSELNILKGAKQALQSVVAVLVEVEFEPLYKSQPLFGDIHKFLLSEGFVLMDIQKGVETVPSRGPIGARAKGQLTWGDALYFRRPENAERSALAFCALAFGYSDYARTCFPLGPVVYPAINKLLKEFEDIVKLMPNKLPQTFADVYSQIDSKQRYDVATLHSNKTRIKKRIKREFIKVMKFIKVYYFIRNFRRRKDMNPLLKFAKKYGLDLLHNYLIQNLKH